LPRPLLAAAVFVVLLCLVVAVATRRFRPTVTLPVTYSAGGLVLLAAAIGSGSLGPLLAVLATFVFAWLVGHCVLSRLLSPSAEPVVGLQVAIALGFGINGLLLFVLAALGRLNAEAVLALAVTVLALVLLLDRQRLAAGIAHFAGAMSERLRRNRTPLLESTSDTVCQAGSALRDIVGSHNTIIVG
jgi:hypothetical protein